MGDGLFSLRAAVALMAGLAIGGLMTLVVDRMPAHAPLFRRKSRCAKCDGLIAARDHIPVISWVVLRGRCRSCGISISPLYPLVEGTTAVAVLAVALRNPVPWQGLILCALAAILPAVAVMDVQHRIIPNRLMYPCMGIGAALVAAVALVGGPLSAGGAAWGVVLYAGGLLLVAIVTGGMGMGDVKLAAVTGLALGAVGLGLVGVAAALAILLGGLGALAALLMGKGRKGSIPFGPYMALGALAACLWGQRLASWYLDRL